MFSLKHTQACCIAATLLALPGSALAASERVVYSFDEQIGPTDLINVGGKLYGASAYGGAYGNGDLFEVTTDGVESELYSFNLANHGGVAYGSAAPRNLINVGGTLYGTSLGGGATPGSGSVFKLATGALTVLHSFSFGSDGYNPRDLVNVGGKFYGITNYGGAGNNGVFFKLTKTGVETVLHAYKQFAPNGLINVGGTIYSTEIGGIGGIGGKYGAVVKLGPSGAPSVLYAFKGGSDGASPGGLLSVGDAIYGITGAGGAYNNGTLFEVTTEGVEKVLYSFGSSGSEIIGPRSLINVGGTIYGLTEGGGAYGNGTVFKLTTDGFALVYSFKGGSDGAGPFSLTNIGTKLYGITVVGGINNDGTVFEVTP